MKQKQLERWAYAKPTIEAIRLEPHGELMETSFPGQHKPGHHGTGPEEEDDEGQD